MERNELFRDMCILYAEIEAAGCGLPLTQVYCHYLLSASYDDVILVYTRIGYLKRVSMEFTYEIWDEQRQNILAEGYTIHACTDKSGKITRIPPMIADKVRPILSHYLRS
jgi:acyl-CoA thioester hydrolase